MYKIESVETPNAVLADKARGARLQKLADGLSDFRGDMAPVIGAAVAVCPPSITLASGVLVTALTDVIDGKIAREAARLLDVPTTDEGSERDHNADKRLVNCMIGALAARAVIQRHYVTAGILSFAQEKNLARDKDVSQLRETARSEGKDTKAIGINKIKTAVILAGCVVGSSPIANSSRGRTLQNVLIGGGVGLGLIGRRKFEKHLANQTIPQKEQEPIV